MKDKKQQLEPDMVKTHWFQIGKGIDKGCILSLCLFNLYTEYIMRNAGLDESQAGVKTAGRNTNNLRYAYDITLMTENKEKLKDPLMRGKEENEKNRLKTQLSKRNNIASVSHHFMANRRGRSGSSDRFHFLGFQNHCRW